MSSFALDASAVLAYLWKEAGWEVVEPILLADSAIISTLNISEVASKAMERGFDEMETRRLITNLGMTAVDFDGEQAWLAAALRLPTRACGLSLGDRACLALARSQGAVAVTADKIWLSLDVGIVIQSIR